MKRLVAAVVFALTALLSACGGGERATDAAFTLGVAPQFVQGAYPGISVTVLVDGLHARRTGRRAPSARRVPLPFFDDRWELGLAWHIMLAPHDRAKLCLRPRDELAPTPAFEIASWSTALGATPSTSSRSIIRQRSCAERRRTLKLGLVQALMHRPQLLILDEPTLGLEPLVQREFQRLVREIRDEGRTVFLSSHTLSEVERVADRVGIIRNGALLEVAEVSRLKDLAVRRIDFEFALPVDAARFEGIDGVRRVDLDGRVVRVEIEGPATQLMKVAADHEIVDLHIREADLENIFLAYYRGEPGVTRARA